MAVFQRPGRGGAKESPLLSAVPTIRSAAVAIWSRAKTPTSWSIPGYFSNNACLALGQAAGDDDAPGPPPHFEPQHLADDGERFVAGVGDETAGVDDDEIGPVGLGHQPIALQAQQARHPLAIDEVLRDSPG